MSQQPVNVASEIDKKQAYVLFLRFSTYIQSRAKSLEGQLNLPMHCKSIVAFCTSQELARL